ncbi:MAG: hypothetical protein ABEL76_04395, partial [Bradymonadaceae bacterium]
VQQLYVSEHVHRTRRGREKFYSLQLQERGKRDVALLNYLKSPEDALAIERAVESYLQIEDKTVAGEMQGESKGLLGRLFG